jgi:hypothetical protein
MTRRDNSSVSRSSFRLCQLVGRMSGWFLPVAGAAGDWTVGRTSFFAVIGLDLTAVI